MSLPITYPRLPTPSAEILVLEQQNLSAEDLTRHAETSHPKQEWYPTVPTRVTKPELSTLRSDVLGIARVHGFPANQPRSGHSLFDQQLAIHLYEHMGLVPAEASAGGVWSFLALVLLPDVAAWRFPNRNNKRFIGSDTMIGSSNRHVFGRLWARAYIFGPRLISRLNEDNIVNIFERPTFGGNTRLAQAIGSTFVRTVDEHRVTQSQDLMRDAMKRLRRLAYLVSFSALSDDQLSDLLNEIFSASVNALSTQRPR
jgi:Family of unknown function (DUF6339)